jgi:hypothetical protein
MKTIMSLEQYKNYKNGELNLIDIKLQNIGVKRNSTLAYLLRNKKYIIALIVLFACYIESEIYLNNGVESINAYNFNLDSCIDLFKINNKGIANI